MAGRDELRALRAEVKRVQSNTTRKIRRNASKGVRLEGSGVDPRVDPSRIDRYTRTQLQTHLERLGNFNSRRNQFVPGARGVPIPSAEWNKYKQVEKKYNQRIDIVRAAVSGVKPDGMSMTIGERFNVIVPKTGPSMGGGSMRYAPLERSSRGVPSPDKIPALIKDLENRMRPNYESEQEQRIRDNFDKLLKYSNRDDLRDLADKLSPSMFSLLWNFSSTVATLAENYHAILAMMDDDANALELSGIEESYDLIGKQLQWANRAKLDDRLDAVFNEPMPQRRNRRRK